MLDIDALVIKTKSLLANSNAKEALDLLSQYTENSAYSQSAKYLNLLGETLLENSEVEQAYNVYLRSVELNPNEIESVDSCFNLGQIVGGFEGVEFISNGCRLIESKPDSAAKLLQGYFAQIEIWMTDLCMEEQAEGACQELVAKALALDQNNPESWSLLASIEISQQKVQEAKIHIEKAWELFSQKKQLLEDSADNNQVGVDAGTEYIELIQPLTTLTKSAIEVGLLDLAIAIASNIQDISYDLVEPFYLEAFGNYLAAKRLQLTLHGEDSGIEAVDKVSLNIDENGRGENDTITEYIYGALFALSMGLKALSTDLTVDLEISDQINSLVLELGGNQALERVQKESKRVEDETDANIELDQLE